MLALFVSCCCSILKSWCMVTWRLIGKLWAFACHFEQFPLLSGGAHTRLSHRGTKENNCRSSLGFPPWYQALLTFVLKLKKNMQRVYVQSWNCTNCFMKCRKHPLLPGPLEIPLTVSQQGVSSPCINRSNEIQPLFPEKILVFVPVMVVLSFNKIMDISNEKGCRYMVFIQLWSFKNGWTGTVLPSIAFGMYFYSKLSFSIQTILG